jgi:hypothetical protein
LLQRRSRVPRLSVRSERRFSLAPVFLRQRATTLILLLRASRFVSL